LVNQCFFWFSLVLISLVKICQFAVQKAFLSPGGASPRALPAGLLIAVVAAELACGDALPARVPDALVLADA
jgi:hypothetical protein